MRMTAVGREYAFAILEMLPFGPNFLTKVG
jgi:hypothetical protein